MAGQLPTPVPAPRLLWTFDDSQWVALVFEDIDGTTPVLPWRPDQLHRVLAALTDLRRRSHPPLSRRLRSRPDWARYSSGPGATPSMPGTGRGSRSPGWRPGPGTTWNAWPPSKHRGRRQRWVHPWCTVTSGPTTSS